MDKNKYIEDLKDIRQMMQRSSKFLSLSGLSGILAGIYALIGAYLAYLLLDGDVVYLKRYSRGNIVLVQRLLIIASTVAVLAIVTAYVLTSKKAKKNGQKIWDYNTKLLLVDFLIPLVSGGVFGLILLYHEHFGIMAPITLIFYGLALVSASEYTLTTVKYLGVSEIITGLLSALFVGYGLFFWAFGFGVLHIVYGTIMYLKERKA